MHILFQLMMLQLNGTSIISKNVESLTSIGFYGFAYVTSTVDLVIPNTTNTLTVGNYAFQGCTGLTSLTIGKNCKLLYNVFDGISSKITSVSFAGSSTELINSAKTWNSTWYKTSSISSLETEGSQAFDVTTLTYAS